ncbi:MAG: 30S ribosomal protein S3 [Clostridiales bacterium]|nr:30S ribosomal protein S3 [Clostridiales bacterium]
MGQKVNPHGLRVGVIKNWDSRWIAGKDMAANIAEDNKLRTYLKNKLYTFSVSKIEIERKSNNVTLFIYTAKPGALIGKGGAGIEALSQDVQKLVGKNVKVNIMEIKKPDMDAQLVAESIAQQLEKRVSFRRAMKQSMQRVTRAGAKGIKILVSGRLGGAEIARSEGYHEGSIPLQTLRADIDYGFAEAATTYGRIGVKVWVYKGEVLAKKAAKAEGGK